MAKHSKFKGIRMDVKRGLTRTLRGIGITTGLDGRPIEDITAMELATIYCKCKNIPCDFNRLTIWTKFAHLALTKVSKPKSHNPPKIQKQGIGSKIPKVGKVKTHWKDAYFAYLKSPKWKKIRVSLFQQRGRKCEECGAERFLEIHHLTYARLYNEKMSDLKILCNKCHGSEHGIRESNYFRVASQM